VRASGLNRVRPHPDPLPRDEGVLGHAIVTFGLDLLWIESGYLRRAASVALAVLRRIVDAGDVVSSGSCRQRGRGT